MGINPPDVGEGVVNSVTHLVSYIVLYTFHVILEIVLVILGVVAITDPMVLRATSFDIILASIAVLDILISRGL